MSQIISQELAGIINDKETLKVIASTSPDGIPHVVFKGSLHVNADGELEFYEIIESSQNNKNMTNSIWFQKPVAVNVLSADRRSFEIVGVAKKAIIAGSYFEEVYKSLQSRRGDSDLSTIWIIEPTAVREETFLTRVAEEEEAHPHILHLDRIAKN